MSSQSTESNGWIERIVTAFAKGLNVISAVWLASVAVLILYDVVGREFFDSPFYGTNEIVSNSVLSILMLQLPLAVLTRTSLRTTILYGLAGTRGKGYIDALSYVLAFVLFLVIAAGGWPNMVEAWDIGEQEGSGIIEIPVYPIRTLVVVVGIFGMVVCALLVFQSLFQPERSEDSRPAFEGE